MVAQAKRDHCHALDAHSGGFGAEVRAVKMWDLLALAMALVAVALAARMFLIPPLR